MELFDTSETSSFSPYKEFVKRHGIVVNPIHLGGWEPSSEHQTLDTKIRTAYRAKLGDKAANGENEKEAVFNLSKELSLKGAEEISWT